MSTALHLCAPDDFARLAALSARHDEELGRDCTDEHRQDALAPLLEGSPLGAAYIAGPKTAPIGYIIVSFGWSVALGGMTGTVDEIWIRPSVRGRGLGTEILTSVSTALASVGLKALRAEVDRDTPDSHSLFRKARFVLDDGAGMMTRLT